MEDYIKRSIQSVTIQLTHTASHLVVSIGITNSTERNDARKQRKTSALKRLYIEKNICIHGKKRDLRTIEAMITRQLLWIYTLDSPRFVIKETVCWSMHLTSHQKSHPRSLTLLGCYASSQDTSFHYKIRTKTSFTVPFLVWTIVTTFTLLQ